MINSGFNIDKTSKEQVKTCMYTTFGEITQPFIKSRLAKDNTSVLSLLLFYETITDDPKKYFIVLSCVICCIIYNSLCINYLACLSETLSEITVGSRRVSKYGDNIFNISTT